MIVLVFIFECYYNEVIRKMQLRILAKISKNKNVEKLRQISCKIP